jgi:alpha-galactosidase
MLLVGNPGLSVSEQRAQFAIWAILSAPLYISSDLRSISEEALEILRNEEVVAINQDILGKQGFVISHERNKRIWLKNLEPSQGGEERLAVLFENTAATFSKTRFDFNLELINWSVGSYSVRDVHAHSTVVTDVPCSYPFTFDVDESSVELFVFTHHLNVYVAMD